MVADTFLPMVDPTYGRPHLRGARHCRDGQPEVPGPPLNFWDLILLVFVCGFKNGDIEGIGSPATLVTSSGIRFEPFNGVRLLP